MEVGAPAVVVLEGVPVELFLESQDHQHDLIRELVLVDLGVRTAVAELALPQRVTALIADILHDYRDVRSQTRDQALAARERGEATTTLHVPVRPGLVDALRRWLRLVEEADRCCDEGALLTLPASPEIRTLRRWYVEAVANALADPPSRVPYPAEG